VFSGHGREEREHAGVGVVLSREARKIVTGFECSQSGRLMVVGLDTAPRVVTVVVAYAPQSGTQEDERLAFMEELDEVVSAHRGRGPVLVLGDLNARLHGRLRGEESIIGPHVFGRGCAALLRPEREYEEASNRELLLEVCRGNGLRIMSIWFRKSDRRRVTFVAPGVQSLRMGAGPWSPEDFAQLDLCLV